MEYACLGSRMLHPHRQLLAGGQPIALGKRALDVLSRLAEAHGEVVTKDELLEAVWPGTIVEDNALQAQVVAARKALGPEADRLKTIRGIGYSLDVDAGRPTVARQEDRPRVTSRPWRGRGALIAVGIALAAGAVAALTWPQSAPVQVMEVGHFASTGGPQAGMLAQSLDGEIVSVLNRSAISTRGPEDSAGLIRPQQASWRLAGNILQNGHELIADLRMEDAPTGTVLWSRRFQGDASAPDRISAQASAAVARTVYSITELMLQKGIKVDPSLVALQIRGSDLVRSKQPLDEATPLKIYEELVRRAPRLAHGHALLALTLSENASSGPVDARVAARTQAHQEAARAIAIDPAGSGAAYDALYFLSRDEHPHDLAAAEAILAKGLRKAPGFAYLWMRECRFLAQAGRGRDAIPYCQRALSLSPYAEPIWHSHARVQWETGDYTSAQQTVTRAATFAPEHRPTRDARFELAAFGGDSGTALRLLDDPDSQPVDLQPAARPIMRQYLQHWGAWPAGQRGAIGQHLLEQASSGALPVDWAVMTLASLGQTDRAFALLDQPGWEDSVRFATGFLFQPVTKPMRADPRFWDLAARTGLTDYWRASGRWPDMCGTELPIQTCKDRAAQALARAG